ncbi:MAG: nucleotide sugar dehydrogenase, partial [Prevotellaceae bacterium]|nr:nucleotide sugar dehydrogenase [Prevotellaceae bacterium]
MLSNFLLIDMFSKIKSREAKIALVGLGYVGLPIALAFAKKCNVIGFEIDPLRLEKLRKGEDPSRELSPEAFDDTTICFSDSIEDLSNASFFIVAVPTPVDKCNQPDLRPLLSATETVGKVLKRGDYVVYESTVFPGCTEEECIPLLERLSCLTCGPDFKVGYSPERINPGDLYHTLSNTIKIVSGCDAEALDQIAQVYEIAVEAGVHRAPSIKVAEMAKIIENTQRDVNIALMNELSIIAGRLGVNIYDV